MRIAQGCWSRKRGVLGTRLLNLSAAAATTLNPRFRTRAGRHRRGVLPSGDRRHASAIAAPFLRHVRARPMAQRFWLMKSEPDECSIDDALAAAKTDRAVDRRAQLPGAQLHARPDAGRRRRAVLPLELRRAGHRRPRAKSRAAPTPMPRSSTRRASTTTRPPSARSRAGCRSTCSGIEKTRVVTLPDLREHAAARGHGGPAPGQPPVDHAGDARRMALHHHAPAERLSWLRS